MKLLLTSEGIKNKSIEDTLFALVGKPAEEIRIAYILTGAVASEQPHKDWVINALKKLDELKIKEIDILDIAGLPKDMWLPRIEAADVIYVEGGRCYFLLYWLEKSGLKDLLPKLLETKVYVGASAGSLILGKNVFTASPRKYSNEIPEFSGNEGLGIVDFSMRSHYGRGDRGMFNKDSLQDLAEENKTVIYALDDDSAVLIDGDKFEVISEGKWEKFE